MKCPICKEPDLVMAERQNIEIDYCPQCRGVWLDRGELDKIIERSQQEESRYTGNPMVQQPYVSAPPPSMPTQAGEKSPGPSSFLNPSHGGFNDFSQARVGGHHGSDHEDRRHAQGGFLRRLFD